MEPAILRLVNNCNDLRGQVRLWRTRWLAVETQLAAAEAERVTDQELLSLITKVLSDDPRLGTPKFFSVEQVVQIVALACETPEESERTVSHWSARELADEAVLRGIVEKVSPRSVGRFLKRSQLAAPSTSLLANCQA